MKAFIVLGLILARISASNSLGLDDPFRSSCVFNIVGESIDLGIDVNTDADADADNGSDNVGDGDDAAESDFLTMQGNISSSKTRGRDCVVVFRNLPKGKIRLNFRLPESNLKQKSTGKDKQTEKEQRLVGLFYQLLFGTDSIYFLIVRD